MKNFLFLFSTLICLLVMTSALVHANEASIEANVAGGDDSPIVYQLGIKQ